MTTIRDYCATLAGDVAYLLMCIPDGSFDPVTLQEISDRADDARDLLRAEPAGEVPTPAEIDELTWQHTSDLGDNPIGVAVEDVPALVHAALARWGRPATPPVPEVGEVAELVECLTILRDNSRGIATRYDERLTRIATLLLQPPAPAPAVVPVAVSERLPDPRPESEGGDCDAEGRCWAFTPRRATPFPSWTLLWIGHMQPHHSHWRPASAIPLPQVGEVE